MSLVPWSTEWKEEKLHEISARWSACELCPLSKTRTNVVVGEGNPNARMMLIGECPGEEEDTTGSPFRGAPGELMNALLEAAGFSRRDIFITNLIGCRPLDDNGKNREPSTIEKNTCMARVYELVYLVDPWIIVPVGKVALKALGKGREMSILENHGQVFSSAHISVRKITDRGSMEIPGKVFPKKDLNKQEINLEYDMVPILHPSYLLREDSFDIKKKKFPADGPTQRTFENLVRIKKYIATLEAAYSQTSNP